MLYRVILDYEGHPGPSFANEEVHALDADAAVVKLKDQITTEYEQRGLPAPVFGNYKATEE